jgi:GrpB-like predicted nucleotidyltransferase (UPF0157 family)
LIDGQRIDNLACLDSALLAGEGLVHSCRLTVKNCGGRHGQQRQRIWLFPKPDSMPSPIPVELHPYDPRWAENARTESARLAHVLGASLVTVHHIGSTAIPGIRAKPILDLIPVLASSAALDETRTGIESLGYISWGEYGLIGRRYYTLDDPVTGVRKVQLHCYGVGSPEITRHVAFRDYLCARPEIAQAYDAEKARCRERHPLDSHAYSDCKSKWVERIQEEALRAQH